MHSIESPGPNGRAGPALFRRKQPIGAPREAAERKWKELSRAGKQFFEILGAERVFSNSGSSLKTPDKLQAKV